MAKIVLTFVLCAAVIAIQGFPASYDDVLAAAKSGNWDKIQELLRSDLAENAAWKPETFGNVRNLKPPQGGHVYGEAVYTYHSASNINGKQTEDGGGHKIINDDGKVNEFDFNPLKQ